jgi:hypothetical protein
MLLFGRAKLRVKRKQLRSLSGSGNGGESPTD